MSCEKKNISHPTKLVGQQVCSSIYEQSSCNRSRISINVQTFFSKPIFSHKKKDHVRQKVHQSSPRSISIPLKKKKTFNKKLSSLPFFTNQKKVQTQKSTGHPTFFVRGTPHSRRLTNQRPNTRPPPASVAPRVGHLWSSPALAASNVRPRRRHPKVRPLSVEFFPPLPL